MARKFGARSRISHRQPVARDRAWQSMRILRQFTVHDIAATADIGLDNAKRYNKGLVAAGYIVIARPKANGRKGGYVIYRLVRNHGPKAPRLQSDGNTYDPNIDHVYPGGIAQIRERQNGETPSE